MEGVGSGATDHLRSRGRRQATSERGTRDGIFDILPAIERLIDGAIAGTAAQIAFQRRAEILPLRLVERCAGYDHARGAEPALKGLRIQIRLLPRMGGP